MAPQQVATGTLSPPRRRDDRSHSATHRHTRARAQLRDQIGRLERRLSDLVCREFPFMALPAPTSTASGPQLLGLAELERTRDDLAARVVRAQRAADDRALRVAKARQQLERVKAHPERFKGWELPVRALGQNGCGVWRVAPRLGLIGRLAGWWELTLSSGCPLAVGRGRRRDPPPQG